MPSTASSPGRRCPATAAALGGVLLAALAAAQDTVDWQDAASCVGRVCSVRGTVAEVQDDGPVIRLYFDAARHDVYATLVRGWLVTWPEYAGHAIVATGPVNSFRAATEIMLRDPGAVVVLDAPLTATPPSETATEAPTLAPTLVPTPVPTLVPTAAASPAAPAPAATATSAEADQLRQRVRELEERVRQLEGAH